MCMYVYVCVCIPSRYIHSQPAGSVGHSPEHPHVTVAWSSKSVGQTMACYKHTVPSSDHRFVPTVFLGFIL